MLTEEEIRQDLAKLKDIVIAHKAQEAELAIHPETINGQDYEVFTNAPGKYVPLSETIRGFKGIVNGEYDDIPEQAFYMTGNIDEVVEKAKTEAA